MYVWNYDSNVSNPSHDTRSCWWFLSFKTRERLDLFLSTIFEKSKSKYETKSYWADKMVHCLLDISRPCDFKFNPKMKLWPNFFSLNFASILKSSFAKNSLYGIRLMLPSSISRRLRFSQISCWCYKTLFFLGGGGNLDFPPNKEIENKIVLVFKPALKYENNEANFKQI